MRDLVKIRIMFAVIVVSMLVIFWPCMMQQAKKMTTVTQAIVQEQAKPTPVEKPESKPVSVPAIKIEKVLPKKPIIQKKAVKAKPVAEHKVTVKPQPKPSAKAVPPKPVEKVVAQKPALKLEVKHPKTLSKTTPVVAKPKKVYLQTGVFKGMRHAVEQNGFLHRKGFLESVIQARGEKDRLFTVLVGPYPNEREGHKAQQKLQEITAIHALVIQR